MRSLPWRGRRQPRRGIRTGECACPWGLQNSYSSTFSGGATRDSQDVGQTFAHERSRQRQADRHKDEQPRDERQLATAAVRTHDHRVPALDGEGARGTKAQWASTASATNVRAVKTPSTLLRNLLSMRFIS